MKQTVAKNIQNMLVQAAVKSEGRSIPFLMYERKISKELSEEIAKLKHDRADIKMV